MPSRVQRVLVIGWDAADWKMIDPLLASGAMPHLKRLIDRGVRADLASLDPKLSPILWTSIATGKTADKHGVLNFIEPDAQRGTVRVVSSTSRKTRALWNMMTLAGKASVVVNWYASHPAEPIRGACVSNLFQEGVPTSAKGSWPMLPGVVHPEQCIAEVSAARVHPSAAPLHDLRALVPRSDALPSDDRRHALLRRLIAQCRSVHQAAMTLMTSQQPWQCAMVFYDMIDVAGHHFMQYHPPRMAHVSKRDFAALSGVMAGVYRLHDRMLGELMRAAGDDATIVLLSDHGFHSDHLRPTTQTAADDEHAAMDATWHRETGVLVMAGPGVQPSAQIHGPGLLDIAPTILTLLGMPIGEDMDGRVLMEALEPTAHIERIASWDTHPGEAGEHPPDMRSDAFEATEALRQLADLGYIQPIGDDLDKTLKELDRETRSNLGVVYLTTRRIKHALPVFEQLHADFPHDVRFATNLAHCFQATGRMEDAERVLTAYLQAHPDAQDAQLLQATVLSTRGRHEQAIALLQMLIDAHPNDRRLLTTLADVLRAAGRLDDADRTLVKVLALDPRNTDAMHRRALVALEQRHFEQAAEQALNALELKPTFAEANATLGIALAWMNDLENAMRSFELAVSLQPGLIDAHLFLSEIHAARGEIDKAGEHRGIAERLRARAVENAAHMEQLNRETPTGPQQWARQMRAHDRRS